MIEVDEENFLIVTDIDRLIHIISSSGRIDLGRLSKELKMSKKEVEKWLHVLEDEGLIRIEHSLTKVYAVWVGEREPEQSLKVKRKPAAVPKGPDRPVALEPPKAPPRRPPVSIFYERKPGALAGEEAPAVATEEAAEEHAPEIIEAPAPAEILAPEERKEKAMRPFLETPVVVEEEPITEESEQPLDEAFERGKLEKLVPEELPKRHTKSEKAAKKKDIFKPKKPPAKTRYAEMAPVETSGLRERLDDYLKLIKEGQRELRDLEAEKGRIYEEGYRPLEAEFESNLENIEYAILEKEKKILEAKERVAELPEKLEAVEKLQEGLSGVEKNARDTLQKTKEQLDERWAMLEETSEELREQLEQGEEEAMKERTRVFEMKGLLQSISQNEESVRTALEENKKRIEEVQESVSSLEESLADLVDARALLAERVDTAQGSLERRVQALEELREQLESIKNVEGWFKEYSEDYERKITDLEDYVANAQDELAHLMEAAELEYVRKYLDQLSTTEEKYKDRLRELELEGMSVDEKISEVRSRIRELLKESGELMEKSRKRSETSGKFPEKASEARIHSRQKLAMLEEKATEGESLSEEIKKIRGRKKKKK